MKQKKFSLPKALRVKKAAEFQRVFDSGRCKAGKYLTVYVVNRNDDAASRLAVAAGKKLGKACVRNRLKRMLRETWRLNRHKIATGCDVLLLARRAAINQSTPQIEKCFQEIARQMKIFRRNGG